MLRIFGIVFFIFLVLAFAIVSYVEFCVFLMNIHWFLIFIPMAIIATLIFMIVMYAEEIEEWLDEKWFELTIGDE